MSSGTLVFKVDLAGDLRRFQVSEGVDHAETWQNLLQGIHQSFETQQMCKFLLKYKDEDGDLCTLVQPTLQDCIAQAGGKAIRLQASRAAASTPEAPQQLQPSQPQQQQSPAPPAQQQQMQQPHPQVKAPQQAQQQIAQQFQPPREDVPRLAPSTDQASEEGDAASNVGSRGVGPWKLLSCLGSLKAANRMNAPMIASLVLQFLPIMAQRAHRKQEKLNHVGAKHREMLAPLLQRIFLQLDSIPGAAGVKMDLGAFISEDNVGKFGDCLSNLMKVLLAIEPKASVAYIIKDVSEELVDVLPRVFPEAFSCQAPPLAEHVGTCCKACNVGPICGPRFHNAASSIDLCGECYIDFGSTTSRKFECHLTAGTAVGGLGEHDDHWHQGANSAKARDNYPRSSAGEVFQEIASAFAGFASKGKESKNKGKDKKSKGKTVPRPPGQVDAEQNRPGVDEWFSKRGRGGGSDTGSAQWMRSGSMHGGSECSFASTAHASDYSDAHYSDYVDASFGLAESLLGEKNVREGMKEVSRLFDENSDVFEEVGFPLWEGWGDMGHAGHSGGGSHGGSRPGSNVGSSSWAPMPEPRYVPVSSAQSAVSSAHGAEA